MLEQNYAPVKETIMLRFWLVCFVILFVLVELWEWLRGLTLPLPFCIIGGVILAIASNVNLPITSYFSPPEATKLHPSSSQGSLEQSLLMLQSQKQSSPEERNN